MGLSVWTQYVLDNFATVDEAVAELSKEKFRIDAPDLPNGVQSRLHLAISDPSGDSAIFEYRDGKLEIHHGRQCQVMTNSPFYDDQLAILGYWAADRRPDDAARGPTALRTASCGRRSTSTPSCRPPTRRSPCRP